MRTAASALFLTAAIATALHAIAEPAPNPRASAPLIDRGLASERAHDIAAAERDLLQAARLDRQYLPAWTLANFYFRQQNRDGFWLWAHRAATLAYDDLAPLLQLADSVDPGHALAHLASSPMLEHAYLDLLIHQNRLAEAVPIARQMLSRHSGADTPRLRDFATRLIAANRASEALEIWNGIIPSSEPSPPGPISEAGFDWQIPTNPGISMLWRDVRRDVRRDATFDFILEGRQPETCRLLERVIVTASHPRRLSFEYSTDLSGLHWIIEAQADDSKARDFQESPPLAPSTWREFQWTLPPTHVALVRLALLYHRESGTPRAEGRLQIRKIHFT